jgi:RNA polymerase sigma-70 factor (ECF subfamily)
METIATENQSIPAVYLGDPDLILVDATRNGDMSAFEELVRKYDRKLFRIAQSVTHNTEDAEEVVQTAFFKAYCNLGRFQGNARFLTWLTRIALNESLMKLRKQRAVRERSIDAGFDQPNDTGIASSTRGCTDLTDWSPNPESLYATVERRAILVRCLGTLSSNLRVVFVLRDIDGYSIIETSEILRLTPNAVKARLSRARLQLREQLTIYFKKRD